MRGKSEGDNIRNCFKKCNYKESEKGARAREGKVVKEGSFLVMAEITARGAIGGNDPGGARNR